MRLKINFLVRPSKVRKNGLAPIECSITVNCKRIYLILPRYLSPENWSQSQQKAKGKSINSSEINNFLEVYRNNLYTIQTQIIQENLPFNIETFKSILNGNQNESITLLKLYKKHNEDGEELKNKKLISNSTYNKYLRTHNHLKNYLKKEYNKEDILFQDINKSFIEGFNHYLKIEFNIHNNTIVNYMKNLRKILLIAFNDKIIKENPFQGIKLKVEKTTIEYLTLEEIRRIYSKDFENKRLNNIKDCFIFCCMTGLAFIDAKSLTKNNIKIDSENNEWICLNRNKTNVLSQIPLLPIAKEILIKYDYKLPIPTNQKYNAYLKEIGDICKIDKELRSHLARYSFATLTLNKGVSIKAVSSMLGHTNTKMTEHYSKLMSSTIYNEMNNLKDIL